MSMEQGLLWIGFTAIIVSMLAFDLFYLVGRMGVVDLREALLWSAMWIAVSLAFGGVLFVVLGRDQGVQYLTGYVIEKALSVDNIFVFLIIFEYFNVPAFLQPKVLRWGIIGALIMRFIFILAGATLLATFHWMLFVFGGLVLFAALRLATQREAALRPGKNPVVRLVRRVIPVAPEYGSGRFMLRLGGTLMATPLLIVLIVVETTDLFFALDSIPAILAVTDDTFILYTSNAFAILGLRALYFVLAGAAGHLRYLRQGAVAILAFVGVKLLISDVVELPVVVPLAVVAGILAGSIGLSVLFREKASGAPGTSPVRRIRARD
ncbi:MAG: TerC/Alx family metal homeostasis membrane protein [Dehalococcoidia bacterium]